MTVIDEHNAHHTALAINEVSLLRQSYQAASLSIQTDGKMRLDDLICDGVMIATPAGSTAYNLVGKRTDPATSGPPARSDTC